MFPVKQNFVKNYVGAVNFFTIKYVFTKCLEKIAVVKT